MEQHAAILCHTISKDYSVPYKMNEICGFMLEEDKIPDMLKTIMWLFGIREEKDIVISFLKKYVTSARAEELYELICCINSQKMTLEVLSKDDKAILDLAHDVRRIYLMNLCGEICVRAGYDDFGIRHNSLKKLSTDMRTEAGRLYAARRYEFLMECIRQTTHL